MSFTSKNPKFNSITVGGTKDDSAIADFQSNSAGIGLPNLTEAERDGISTPKSGLVIFNTTTSELNVYAGSEWTEISPSVEIQPQLRSKWKVTDDSVYTSGAIIDFDVTPANFTNVGTWANTDGTITIPETGTYMINCTMTTDGAVANNKYFEFYIDGSFRHIIGRGDGSARMIGGSVVLDLTAGDLFTVRLNAAASIYTESYETWLDFVKLT